METRILGKTGLKLSVLSFGCGAVGGLMDAFQKRSYAKLYELTCERLVRDRLYDAVCFFTSNSNTGKKGKYTEPDEELGIKNFAISLHARAAAFAKMGKEVKVLERKGD